VNRVVLIGDSIRMGYQQTVRADLVGVAEVSWPEANGFDSRNVLANIDDWAADLRPDLVHINCGLHDLKRDRVRGQLQVPLEEYAVNVEKIFWRLAARTKAKVIWAMTTPVNERWHRAQKPFDRFEADVRAYNAAAAEVCTRRGVPVNDLYAAVMAAGRDRYLVADGVHFNEDGYRLLGAEVAGVIRRSL
jgi:lysophospholipase L1-like esterase